MFLMSLVVSNDTFLTKMLNIEKGTGEYFDTKGLLKRGKTINAFMTALIDLVAVIAFMVSG